jgi:hypothetical protein
MMGFLLGKPLYDVVEWTVASKTKKKLQMGRVRPSPFSGQAVPVFVA